MDFLSQQYRLFLRFWKETLTRYLPLSAFLLMGSILLGYVGCVYNPDAAEEAMDAFRELVEESGAISSDGRLKAIPILNNNWSAMMNILVYGVIPFCYLPALSLASNGLLLGMMAAHYYNNGLPVMMAVAGVLPHGIFEIPALILAGAGGTYFCQQITRRIRRRNKSFSYGQILEDLLRVLLLAIFPLILIAAVVECYVTPQVLSMFF